MGVSDAGELHDGNPPPCSRLLCMTQPQQRAHRGGGRGAIVPAAARAHSRAQQAVVYVPWHPDVLTSWTHRIGTGWGGEGGWFGRECMGMSRMHGRRESSSLEAKVSEQGETASLHVDGGVPRHGRLETKPHQKGRDRLPNWDACR